MPDAVPLTDLDVITRYSIAVRSASADRGELIETLRGDLEWLESGVVAPDPVAETADEAEVTEAEDVPAAPAAAETPATRKAAAPKKAAPRKAAPRKAAPRKAAPRKAAAKKTAGSRTRS
jgi:hypothetical protein